MKKQQQTLIRREDVEKRTGLKCSSMYALIADGKFPKQVPLGGNRVAWIESEIDSWIDGRIQLRDAA